MSGSGGLNSDQQVNQTSTQESINQYLGDDHDRLDDLFNHFYAIAHSDSKQATALFKEFSFGLKRHIVWEEELLFPLFERDSGMSNSGPTVVMRSEHSEIKTLLDDIEEVLQSQHITLEHADQLKAILESHNMKEEQILYPAMDRLFSRDDTDEVIQQMKAESE